MAGHEHEPAARPQHPVRHGKRRTQMGDVHEPEVARGAVEAPGVARSEPLGVVHHVADLTAHRSRMTAGGCSTRSWSWSPPPSPAAAAVACACSTSSSPGRSRSWPWSTPANCPPVWPCRRSVRRASGGSPAEAPGSVQAACDGVGGAEGAAVVAPLGGPVLGGVGRHDDGGVGARAVRRGGGRTAAVAHGPCHRCPGQAADDDDAERHGSAPVWCRPALGRPRLRVGGRWRSGLLTGGDVVSCGHGATVRTRSAVGHRVGCPRSARGLPILAKARVRGDATPRARAARAAVP